jgi:predicted acyl esterase
MLSKIYYHEKKISLALLICSFFNVLYAQTDTIASYTKKSYMIPVRGWDKALYCSVCTCTAAQALPISSFSEHPTAVIFQFLMISAFSVNRMGGLKAMAREGYIFVFQDLRGKFKSEGTFEMNRPLYHLVD